MRVRAWLLAALIAAPLALPAAPVAAHDEDGAGIDRFGSRKFWEYAACGASIAFASGTGGWILAGIVCGKVLTEFWAE